MESKDLQISLYHLDLIVKEAANILDSLENLELSNVLLIPIFNYLSIRTCAFYDELNQHFIKKAISEELRFRKILKTKEYIEGVRDKYCPDLYKIRNTILAHNFRIKATKYESIFFYPTEYLIPASNANHIFNITLMDSMLSTIKFLYPEIYNEVDKIPCRPKETLLERANYHEIAEKVSTEIQKIADSI